MRSSVFALLACGLLCGCPPKSSPSVTPPAATSPAPAQPSGSVKSDAPTKPSDAAAAKPADTGSKVAVESFWKDVGVGTVAQYSMVTDMQKPMKMKTETSQAKTLASKDDKGYVLKVVTTANGTAMPAQEEKGDWVAPTGSGAAATTAPKDLGNEKVKVGGGEFDCKHWQTESDMAGTKTTTDTWTTKNLLVKMTMKNDNMTVTSELTKLDKK